METCGEAECVETCGQAVVKNEGGADPTPAIKDEEADDDMSGVGVKNEVGKGISGWMERAAALMVNVLDRPTPVPSRNSTGASKDSLGDSIGTFWEILGAF